MDSVVSPCDGVVIDDLVVDGDDDGEDRVDVAVGSVNSGAGSVVRGAAVRVADAAAFSSSIRE